MNEFADKAVQLFTLPLVIGLLVARVFAPPIPVIEVLAIAIIWAGLAGVNWYFRVKVKTSAGRWKVIILADILIALLMTSGYGFMRLVKYFKW